MSNMQRSKGARGEREAAALLSKLLGCDKDQAFLAARAALILKACPAYIWK